MLTKTFDIEIFDSKNGEFRSVKNRNVLIYWPHGFGDWVFLGYIALLLSPANRYFITRFGDDTVSLYEGCDIVRPIYSGVKSVHCDEGGAYGIRHLGLGQRDKDQISVPLSIHDQCVSEKIDMLFHVEFWETEGQAKTPFHSKARQMARNFAIENDERLKAPLSNILTFGIPKICQRLVESRLKNFLGFGQRRLCVIGRNGYTSVGKNWGHRWREDLPPERRREGEECRDFMRLMLRKDPNWAFLVIEDRWFTNDDTIRDRDLNCWSYAELFGAVDEGTMPFGLVMKAILNLADLMIGVPAGPYHLAMIKKDLPTIGLWTEHFPSWYDEPKEASLHLCSRNLRDEGILERPGSIREFGGAMFGCWDLDTRPILAEQVVGAVESLLGASLGRTRKTKRPATVEFNSENVATHSKVKQDNILVAICSCNGHRDHRDGIRETWLSELPDGIKHLFFVGGGDLNEGDDVLRLDSPDHYDALPIKVHSLFRHVMENCDFDYLFKCDDDTYLAIDRLRELVELRADLVGDRTLYSGWPCGGAGYLLSRRSVKLLAEMSQPGFGAEDVWVGRSVRGACFQTIVTEKLQDNSQIFPRQGNDLVTAHHCSPRILVAIDQMYRRPDEIRRFHAQHREWKGTIELAPNGVFLGGGSNPHGRWQENEEGLVLSWDHWGVDRLLKTEWGYNSGNLRLTCQSTGMDR